MTFIAENTKSVFLVRHPLPTSSGSKKKKNYINKLRFFLYSLKIIYRVARLFYGLKKNSRTRHTLTDIVTVHIFGVLRKTYLNLFLNLYLNS